MRFIDTETGTGLEQSILRKITLRHVWTFFRIHIHKFLALILPNHQTQPIPVESGTNKKEYEAPTVRKLTLEQATLILIGHATIGDQGAKDLMNLAFPERGDSTKSDADTRVA